MRVLVKRQVCNEFFTPAGTWTIDPAQARDFKTSIDAATFCLVHAIPEFELVMELSENELGLIPYAHSYTHHEQPLNDY